MWNDEWWNGDAIGNGGGVLLNANKMMAIIVLLT